MSRVRDMSEQSPETIMSVSCNSWIAVSRETGAPVLETYSERVALAVNIERYEVLTGLAWLQRLNSQLKADRSK